VHPVIAEICRSGGEIRSDVLRRWQRELRDQVQPELDRLAALDAAATSPTKKGPTS
jgi:hypothetical protein